MDDTSIDTITVSGIDEEWAEWASLDSFGSLSTDTIDIIPPKLYVWKLGKKLICQNTAANGLHVLI